MINLIVIIKNYFFGPFLFFLILFPIFSEQPSESPPIKSRSEGVRKYLDLSQHGVSEEYAEYLNIGTQEGMAGERARGINLNTGIDNSGEMMEGILYVYGIEARQKDLNKRIVILLVFIIGIFLAKKLLGKNE